MEKKKCCVLKCSGLKEYPILTYPTQVLTDFLNSFKATETTRTATPVHLFCCLCCATIVATSEQQGGPWAAAGLLGSL